MVNPPLPSQPPRREVRPETPLPPIPEKAPPEAGAETPEPTATPPEAEAKPVAETLAAKQEEIKAEQTGEAPSVAAMSGQVAASSLVPASPPPARGYVSAADLKNLASRPREEQVKYLTEIVYQKGLDRAIATVQHLNDPYLFDLLHDTLVTELYQKLKGPRLKNK